MRGRTRPRGRPETAPLPKDAAGRAWQGDADGGRHHNGATAPRPPIRLAELPPDDREDSVAHRLARAGDELKRLDRQYRAAIQDGLRARERDEIAAAFDRGDALQGRMLSTLHQARQLERELAMERLAEIHALPTPAGSGDLTSDPNEAA